jgi:hypothetical protein
MRLPNAKAKLLILSFFFFGRSCTKVNYVSQENKAPCQKEASQLVWCGVAPCPVWAAVVRLIPTRIRTAKETLMWPYPRTQRKGCDQRAYRVALSSAKTGKLLLKEENLTVSNGVQVAVKYKVIMRF